MALGQIVILGPQSTSNRMRNVGDSINDKRRQRTAGVIRHMYIPPW
jgi:hypothetical protein